MGGDKPTFLLLRSAIPARTPGELIGRFVVDPARPLDNSAPDNPGALIQQQIVEIEERQSDDVIGEIKDNGARLAITGLLDLGGDVQRQDQARIRAKYIKTYRLENHYRAFDALEQHETVRRDLDGPKGLFTRSSGKLYMIIGFKTCSSNSSFQVIHAGGGNFNVKLTIPLSAALTGFPINIADPSLKIHTGDWHVQLQRFITQGEQIFAVEYKVVTQRSVLGRYSAKAETVLARKPMTYEWRNAVYDSGTRSGESVIDGKFDDDEPEEEQSVASNDAQQAEKFFSLGEELIQTDLETEYLWIVD